MGLFLYLAALYLLLLIIAVVVVIVQKHQRRYWQRAVEPLTPCAFQKTGNYLQVKEIHKALVPQHKPIGYLSFSLFGKYERYKNTLYENLKLAPTLLPGWQCRIYVGCDVPQSILNQLLKLGGEVYTMNGISKNFEGATWRFLPAQEDVVFVSRDADDVLNEQDAHNIQAWYKSGKQFFLANPRRTFLPMDAGKWGGRGRCVPDMFAKLDKHCAYPFGFDEHFLRQEIYPLVAQAGYYEIQTDGSWINIWLLAIVIIILIIASLIIAYQLP